MGELRVKGKLREIFKMLLGPLRYQLEFKICTARGWQASVSFQRCVSTVNFKLGEALFGTNLSRLFLKRVKICIINCFQRLGYGIHLHPLFRVTHRQYKNIR
jgi:hypothetical protein